MKKYYKVAHGCVVSKPKSKEITYYGLTLLLDSFIHWKYEDSWFTDEHGEYFNNENLNIDKLYLKDDDDNDILINNLFDQLYTFYCNKLEDDKCLDIGDYDIIIKEDINNDKKNRRNN